ncbi:flagellar hook-associated protein FlgK [Caldifermentibacillus hisashii]|uniref:flagellar hook-associated protein FlgK n=1 Tax=Caldifermentibacillus hisashii TaxID=996558 RepID=UPI0031FBF9A3
MVSTFHGLETAKRGMTTQQLALYTTGHNIANANTPGYTRQRVSFATAEPFPGAGLNRPQIPGQLGTGVEAGAIERVRDAFLDEQYRSENTKLGYYSSQSSALAKMEDILNEPSDTGLQAVMGKFWNSLQDLANNPQNSATRQAVASNGQMVAETFNYYYNSLERIQSDLGNEIDVTVGNINAIVNNINELNKQIAAVEPHGMLPNDLYDKRDLLVDQLSQLVNVKVHAVKPKQYGQASPQAAGLYEIEIVKADGTSYGSGAKLLSVNPADGSATVNSLTVKGSNGTGKPLEGNVSSITVGEVTINNLEFLGELGGLIESYGYKLDEDTKVSGYYSDMLEKLNNLAKAFASEFNKVHRQGFDLSGHKGKDFFEFAEKAAKTLKVNKNIMNDGSLIAAGFDADVANIPNDSIGVEKRESLLASSGNNSNAFRLANIMSKDFSQYESNVTLPDGMTNGSINSYYASIIGDLGVDAQSANRNKENVQVLVDSVQYNRQSVSGVSLDEELTNMITFQHAYNASARMITVIDEMLDKIINGMGVVGR